MDYGMIEGAILDAYRRREFARCFSLLDGFIESAGGEDLGKALCMKSSLVHLVDLRRSSEGLLLVDEALLHLRDNPVELLRTLVNALGLCHSMGDQERARSYEVAAHQLLKEHGEEPAIRPSSFRLHLNLGSLALFRADYATALWHFMQGAQSIHAYGTDDDNDPRHWLFWLHLHTVTASLKLGRHPEASEALEQAKQAILTARHRVQWWIARSDLLRQSSRPEEAQACLDEISSQALTEWDSDSRTRYHLIRALTARDLGHLQDFHRHLSAAHEEAVAGALDYLLSDIQRVERAS